MMFADTKAFSGFSVDNLAAAKQFYTQTLGIPMSDEADGLATLELAGGDRGTLVYEKPNHTPASYTILNFPVDDIHTTVEELTRRGVVFERYEGLEGDEKGVYRAGPLIAWFKDPAGNVMSVLQDT
ncbi:MAG: VOC family protein [Natronosporangium sp.]